MSSRTENLAQLAVSLLCILLYLDVRLASCDHGYGGKADAIIRTLKAHYFSGTVYPYGTRGYAKYRPVEIAECNFLYPMMVIRPADTRDVAVAVKAAREHYVDVSVRSGGHGYNCNSLKNGSLHFDMRRISHIETFTDHYTHQPLARLGPGATWGQVLKVIPEEKYTLVHGSCLTVGVGGYLLGGGSNVAGPPMRYGTGAENVLEYTMVTAEGDVVVVNKDGISKSTYDGSQISTVPNEGENDLFWALKGAGSSYGIVTNFVYKVHPRPETQAVLIFVFLRSHRDFARLQKISDKGRYMISGYRIQRFRKIGGGSGLDMDVIQNNVLTSLTQGLRKWNRSRFEPIPIFFVDLKINGRKTGLGGVVSELRRHGIRSVLPSVVTRVLGLDTYSHSLEDPTQLYRSAEERRKRGDQGLLSATFNLAPTSKTFEDFAYHDPYFGMAENMDSSKRGHEVGCDMCNWFFGIYSQTYGRRIRFFSNDRTKEGYKGTFWLMDFTCYYDHRNRYKSKMCQQQVDRVRRKFNDLHAREGVAVNHYYNTPSCHYVDNETPFHVRYWGENYPHLLKIKHAWDPHNVFNHCHSVGSTEEHCCLV